MKRKRTSRPFWFRMNLNLKPMVDAVPEASAGTALKAAFAYADSGQLPEGLEPLANALFLAMKPSIEDSVHSYRMAVEKGQQGAQKRWGGDRVPIPSKSLPIGMDADIEIETEKEIDTDIEIDQPRCPKENRIAPRELSFHDRKRLAIEKLEQYTG